MQKFICHAMKNEMNILYYILCFAKYFILKIILGKYLLTRKYTLMQVENVGVTNLPPLKKSRPEIYGT